MTTVLLLAALCHSPADEVAAALADVRGLPAESWATTRYLTLYNLPAAEREETAAAVSYLLNAVSRTARIVRPNSLADGRLLRFDLQWYGLPAEVWEELIADGEPYFHVAGNDASTARAAKFLGDGGWLNQPQAAELRALTHSAGAIARADWFLTRLAVPPHYYRFADVAEREADFFISLGLDVKTIGRLRADEGANLIRSGVTRKVRRVARRQGPLGGAWQTYDVEQSTAERDPLRNPFDFTYDATEHIAAKANGLHLFALYDRAGRRQDSVPDRVAKDASDPHGDGIIVPLLSCVRCHVEDGLRPFDNDQRRLLAGDVELFAARPDLAERLAAFYETDLGKRLRRDREDYAAAVAAATGGQTVEATAAALARAYDRYVNELVTPAAAARELGIEGGSLRAALGRSNDPVILALCEGLAVQRQQWEASFAEAALLILVAMR